MPVDLVVDASVVAKLYFVEAQSDLAGATLKAAGRLIAPDLLFLEMASVAAKQVRRGLVQRGKAESAVADVMELLDEAVPLEELAVRAFTLAEAHGVSAYDAAYLTLAEARGLKVITADERLVRKATAAGLGHLVQSLSGSGAASPDP